MKKLNNFLLLALIVALMFQACKTNKNVAKKNENGLSEINKLLKDTIVGNNFSDTICYIFSAKDIQNINSQVAKDICLTPDKLYSEAELYYLLKSYYGESTTSDFFNVVETVANRTTKKEFFQEKTMYYLNALESGEPLDMGPSSNWLFQTRLEKINELPDEISLLFSDFNVFYQIQKSATHTKKEISTIHEGELIPLTKVFNYALKSNGKKLNLQLKDKVKILFTLIYGLDERFSISEIKELDKDNSSNFLLLDYEFMINIKNTKAKCGVRMNGEQIVSLYQISKEAPLLLCTPFLTNK